METNQVIARGFPRDVTEEEIRNFVLLVPGEDGIKKIEIIRKINEANAKIHFMDDKAALFALCFDGMSIRGQKVRLELKELEEQTPTTDILEKELYLLEKEIETISNQPVSPTLHPAAEFQPQTKEEILKLPEPEFPAPAATLAPNIVERPVKSENSRRQKIIAKGVFGILLTIIIALLVVLVLKSERPTAANTEANTETHEMQRKLQHLDKQLEELENLLKG